MQNKKNHKNLKFLPLAIVLCALLFLAFTIFNIFKEQQYTDYKRIDSSIYYRVDNQIYASVPSNGKLVVPDADPVTFHPFSQEYQHRHIGLDKNYVFCGNQILPQLDPYKVQIVKDNYYTDNHVGYYCSARTIENAALSSYDEIYQTFLYMFGYHTKPQTWVYPFYKINNLKTDNVQTKMNGVVVVDGVTYLRGKILPKANGQTLRRISRIYSDGDTRESLIYTADGKHVYADNELLSLEDNPELYSIEIDQQNQQEYLINPHDGMVYLQGMQFDRSHAPYHLLSAYGAHANHSLFLSRDGIYYYEPKRKKIIRAGDNIFLDQGFQEISPLVFSNGKEILFLQNRDVRGGGRSSGRTLRARVTEIFQLTIPDPETFEKIATVKYNYGSVWKTKDTYYYFSNLGPTQLIRNTIYQFNDPSVISALASVSNTTAIRRILKTNKISVPKSHSVLTAKTVYGSPYTQYLGYSCFALAMIVCLFRAFQLFGNIKGIKQIQKETDYGLSSGSRTKFRPQLGPKLRPKPKPKIRK